LSDLHLEFGGFAPPAVAADVTILAGDIHKRDLGIAWAAEHFPPDRTIYLLGNHEHYGGEFKEVLGACRRKAGELGLHLLENASVEIAGVRYIGATLWSDFCLDGSGADQARAMALAGSMINDFRLIAWNEKSTRSSRFEPGDALAQHNASREFLESELARPFAGKTVVITHFLPSRGSIAPRFAESPLNAYFCSDLRELIERHQPALWVHGHTHDSCDYRIGRTRILCNPRGYVGHELNPDFDPQMVAEV
jgi:hypothetical protein